MSLHSCHATEEASRTLFAMLRERRGPLTPASSIHSGSKSRPMRLGSRRPSSRSYGGSDGSRHGEASNMPVDEAGATIAEAENASSPGSWLGICG